MTQEEFSERKKRYAKECAEICCISFQEYNWDKFIQVLDYSTHFGSTRNKYEIYKNNQIITPYLDETGNYKPYQGRHNIRLFQSEKWNGKNDFPIFHQECQKDISTRWNVWNFTLYPSGEYESEFIWDNEAHLDYLETMSKTWFYSFYEEAVYRVEDRVEKVNVPWDFETEVVISFTDNLPNPVIFTTSDRLKMTFKLYLNQVWEYTKKTYASIFKSYDVANLLADNAYNIEQYKMMQSDELRGRFPRWNRATLWIDNTLPDTDSSKVRPKSIKLEWIDENGVIVESATSTEWLQIYNFGYSGGF